MAGGDGARGLHASRSSSAAPRPRGSTPRSRSRRSTRARRCTCSTPRARWAWPSSLLSDGQRDGFVARRRGRSTPTIRHERAATARTSDRRSPLGRGPAPTGWPSTGPARRRPGPLPRGPRVRRLPARGAGGPRSTGRPFFQTWELRGPLSRPSSTTRESARRPATLFGDAQALLDRIVARAAAHAPARCSGSSPPTPRRRRHRALRRRGAEPRGRRSSTPCGSRWPSSRAGPTWRSPTSWPRASRASPTTSGAFAVTAGLGLDELVRGVRGAARRLQRHPRQGAGRPAGRGVRRAAARAGAAGVLGLRARTRRSTTRRCIDGELPGHPAGARLPRLPRSHREADALRAARRRRRSAGITLTESFAMLPGGLGQRLLLLAPAGAVLRRGPDRAGPGGGLRPAQGHAGGGGGAVAGAEPGLRTLIEGRQGGMADGGNDRPTPALRPPAKTNADPARPAGRRPRPRLRRRDGHDAVRPGRVPQRLLRRARSSGSRTWCATSIASTCGPARSCSRPTPSAPTRSSSRQYGLAGETERINQPPRPAGARGGRRPRRGGRRHRPARHPDRAVRRDLAWPRRARPFGRQVDGLLAGGVDGFILETFSDVEELRAAFEAVRARSRTCRSSPR